MGGNPFHLLGVSEKSTDDEIKRAYRKKTRECHPDLFPDDPLAAEAFSTLTEAFEAINTEAKRKKLRSGGGISMQHGTQAAGVEYFERLFCLRGEHQPQKRNA